MLKCVNGEILEITSEEAESLKKVMSMAEVESDTDKLAELTKSVDILIGGEISE